MAPLTSKRGVLELLVHEHRAVEHDLVRAVAGTAEAEAAAAVLREIVGSGAQPVTRRLEELARTGALKAPALGFGESLAKGAAKKALPTTSLVAAALPKVLRDQVGSVLAETTRGGRFARLLEALRHPKVDEWAALLDRAAKLAFKEGERFRGQIATVSGWLLERIRMTTEAFATWAPKRAAEIAAAYNHHMQLAGERAFGHPLFLTHILDGERQLLSDGMRVARSADGRVLIVMIDEVKLESVAGDVRAQFDAVLERIRTRGMYLDGKFVPPDLIDLPVAKSRESWSTELVAYLENAKPRPLVTPSGYGLTVVGVDSREIRDFVEAFLATWRKRVAAKAP